MTTINTMEDLMRLLDESPEWLAAVRARVLTPELLALPEQLARLSQTVSEFAATTTAAITELQAGQEELRQGQQRLEGRVDELQQGQEELRQGQDELRQGQKMLEGRVDELQQGQEELRQGQQRLEGRVDELQQGQDELREGQQRLEGRVDELQEGQDELRQGQRRLEGAVGDLRGLAAGRQAAEEADLIARSMGLVWTRTLSRSEIWDFAESPDAAGIPARDLRSFRRADLLLEVVDPATNQPCYVTVEASYTADERDTNRAVRNADYMTRFTGRPARAAIAALHVDNRIKPLIDSGQVAWHELGEDTLTPE